MKVKDLINELYKLNPDYEVFIVNENLKNQCLVSAQFTGSGIHNNLMVLPTNSFDIRKDNVR